jgi:hypothetical protein
MDHLADFERFRKALARLCETFSKPITNDLMEAWWKALKPVAIDEVERRIDAYIARADDTTKFPKPGQMRPEGAPVPSAYTGNAVRDFWRLEVVLAVAKPLEYDAARFESVLMRHRDALGEPMRRLLDAMEAQHRAAGSPTRAMHRYCEDQGRQIAADFARELREGAAA